MYGQPGPAEFGAGRCGMVIAGQAVLHLRPHLPALSSLADGCPSGLLQKQTSKPVRVCRQACCALGISGVSHAAGALPWASVKVPQARLCLHDSTLHPPSLCAFDPEDKRFIRRRRNGIYDWAQGCLCSHSAKVGDTRFLTTSSRSL